MVDIRSDADALERVLQGSNVLGPHVNNGVGITTHGPRVNDLGDRGQDASEIGGGDSASAKEFDIRLNSKPVDSGVDVHCEAADSAIGDEFVHSSLDRRGREPDDSADVAVVGASIVSKFANDFVVNCVHVATVGRFIAKDPGETQNICV